MGFALQIIENLSGIKETINYGCQMEATCKSWRSYANSFAPHLTAPLVEDSGV